MTRGGLRPLWPAPRRLLTNAEQRLARLKGLIGLTLFISLGLFALLR